MNQQNTTILPRRMSQRGLKRMKALRFGKQAVVSMVVNKQCSHENSEMLSVSKHGKQSDGEKAYERYCAWCARIELAPTDIQTYERVLWRAPVPNCY